MNMILNNSKFKTTLFWMENNDLKINIFIIILRWRYDNNNNNNDLI